MTDFLTINECKYLYLDRYSELGGNDLLLIIEEGGVFQPPKPIEVVEGVTWDMSPVETVPSSRRFIVYFPRYLAYSVLNESYDCGKGKDEVFEGGIAAIFKKSYYLDYICENSFVAQLSENPVHYGLYCADHCMDVITEEPPMVSESRVGDPMEYALEAFGKEHGRYLHYSI